MRSINVTLPNEMSSTNVEIGQRSHSYQYAPSSEVGGNEAAIDTTATVKWAMSFNKSTKVFVALAMLCALLIVIKSGLNTVPTKQPEGITAQSINDAAWMAGSTVGTTYCKTSCTSQCSSYFSVYGPLCCDWAEGKYETAV